MFPDEQAKHRCIPSRLQQTLWNRHRRCQKDLFFEVFHCMIEYWLWAEQKLINSLHANSLLYEPLLTNSTLCNVWTSSSCIKSVKWRPLRAIRAVESCFMAGGPSKYVGHYGWPTTKKFLKKLLAKAWPKYKWFKISYL